MADPLSPRYIRNPDVILREEDADGALLFNPDTNAIKVINDTGLAVWRRCDGRHTLADLVAALDEEFEAVPLDTAPGEVQEFLDILSAGGFLATLIAPNGPEPGND